MQKQEVVEDVFTVCKLLDGDIQVQALQLLAAALSLTDGLSSRRISGLPISDLDVLISSGSKIGSNGIS